MADTPRPKVVNLTEHHNARFARGLRELASSVEEIQTKLEALVFVAAYADGTVAYGYDGGLLRVLGAIETAKLDILLDDTEE